jgi:protein O-mannosyl-transferase
MLDTNRSVSYLPPLALVVTLTAGVVVLAAALQGGFLFDDYPNLESLGAYGGVVDYATFYSFVAGGFAGPTGRPLSLLSFLLNDNAWPSIAYPFKYTNLAIHLLCGVLLCWASLLILRLHGYPERTAQWFAIFAAACWMLHPYFISTTFYVVQRMAQLATLFSLAGIVAYLHGRRLLATRPRRGYGAMSGAVILFTGLAVLSKENGILLPLLIGIIEVTTPRNAAYQGPNRLFQSVFFLLPAAIVLGYLALNIDFSGEPLPTRNFSQTERALTQPRIIVDYLQNLYFPRIEGQGLYRDGIVLSTAFTTPVSTLPALAAVIALVTAGVLLRRRLPLFSLAVLFFFTAHLLESTVLPLELYFEHRNYLAATFLFLPLGAGLHSLASATGPRMPVLLACLILATLMFLSWHRARLWSDTEQLELHWVAAAPDSPRAVNALASWYMRQGLLEDANIVIEEASRRLPDSSLLSARLLLQKASAGTATTDDFRLAADRLAQQPFDAQTVMALRRLAETVTQQRQRPDYVPQSLALLDIVAAAPAYRDLPLFNRLHQYLRGQLLLAEGNPQAAHEALLAAMDLYADTDSALAMVAAMASAGHPDYALDLLDHAEQLFQAQADNTLKRPRGTYEHEIRVLRSKLNSRANEHTLDRAPAPTATHEDGAY